MSAVAYPELPAWVGWLTVWFVGGFVLAVVIGKWLKRADQAAKQPSSFDEFEVGFGIAAAFDTLEQDRKIGRNAS